MTAMFHPSPSLTTVDSRMGDVHRERHASPRGNASFAAYIIIGVFLALVVAGALAFGGMIVPADLICFIGE